MPLLPGHVLVVPHRGVQRMTDLSSDEVTDLFTTVQKVQRLMAGIYFCPLPKSEDGDGDGVGGGRPEDGSFNMYVCSIFPLSFYVAIQ